MLQSHNPSSSTIDCSDKGTIEYLYKKMSRAAMAKAASMVRRHDIAAELVQEAFIKLWQSRIIFPSEKAVYVWIYKTCHRAAIDSLRSARHRYESSMGEDVDSIMAAPTYGDIVMTRQLVQAAIERLKPDEVEAFLYVALDGMTHNEVAELMKLSRRTVQRLLEKVEVKFQEVRHREASGS